MFNLILAFIVTVILGCIMLPILKKMNVSQIVREDGPKEHFKKNGTPTMGGLMILIPLIVFLSIYAFKFKYLILPLIIVIGFGLTGFIDDFKKLVLKNNVGIKPITKILGLVITTIVFLLAYIYVFDLGRDIMVPIFNLPYYLTIPAFIIFTSIVLIGTSNAINLTDGLDGLASSVSIIIMTFFTIVAINNSNETVTILGTITLGSTLAFLLFNVYPAKVFMGDTGSLMLGGVIAVSAILLKMPLYLLVVAVMPVLNTISVIMQVMFFKITKGKRLFKMAPLHHHFELCGMKETTVVSMFCLLTIIGAVIAYII